MADFEVDTEQRPGEVVIRLSGELDLSAFDEVEQVLTNAQSNGNRLVWIDLRGLEFIDSTGIRLLLAAHARAESNGHILRIIRGSELIQRVFVVTDLDKRLPFCEVET